MLIIVQLISATYTLHSANPDRDMALAKQLAEYLEELL